jgi:cobalt-zinc-cadmium efflux system membrane fusion protein
MKTIPTLLLFLLLCTCGPAQEEGVQGLGGEGVKGVHEDEHGHEDGHEDEHHHEEGLHLTPTQIATMGIGFGDFTEMKVNDYLSATGVLGLPPNALIAVSAPAAGFIHNVRDYVEGDYVKRGAVLGYLENPAFIAQQQRYLETAAELSYLQQELARQEALLAADAGILKAVQRLRSEVAAKTATLAGTKQQLQYIGIDVSELTPDNIRDRVNIYAPRGGYITTINLHDGRYVEPSTELMELIDKEHLHLELEVFERDIAKVEVGQRVSYRIPALGNQRFEAEVHVIGKDFNEENKTVLVHAHLKGEQPPFVRGRFAEARIWLDDETVQALPEEAIRREGEGSYIFVAPQVEEGNEVAFERIRVRAGTTEDGFTAVELIDPLPTGARIVTEGAYYVYAQSQASELEHSH